MLPPLDQALEVTQEVNCVTDFLHGCEEQLQDLKKQKQKGLLYGIPVSIKEHIGYKVHHLLSFEIFAAEKVSEVSRRRCCLKYFLIFS